MSFKAQDEYVYSLFTRSCYGMPRNQRRYVWTERNWKELFDDVELVVSGIEPTHFIGSIVLYKEKDRENGISYYTIIDGQQRIITLTIFLSSIAFWLKCYSAENEFKGTKQYIIASDDSDVQHLMVNSEYHLSLNRILYNIIDTPMEKLAKHSVESFVADNTLSGRDKNIASAFRFFLNSLSESLKRPGVYPTEYLVRMRDAITNKLLYVSIIASSEEDACTIFEILNARGSVLEDHELLKNYIMRGMKPSLDLDEAKTVWNEIENELGTSINRFVKHYATHKYRSGTQDGMSDYKIIQISNKGKSAKELLFDIKTKSTYYCKLIYPKKDGEAANCSETEFMVYSFFKKRRQEQIRPLLLSLIHQNAVGYMPDTKYESVILFLYDFFICYNIIGQENSNKITNTIYTFSREIEENYSDETIDKLVFELRGKLPNRESFINSFNLVGWSHHGGYYDDDKDKDRVQIILEALERNKSERKNCDDFTIEHILDDSDDVRNGKIGNLIPLEEHLNQRCKGKALDKKIKLYSKSSFYTARSIYDRYNGKSETFDIDSRTQAMAEEFFDQVLKFKVSSKSGVTESTRKNKKAPSSKGKKTIGDIVGYHENNPTSEIPTFDGQLSLFDE